MMRQLGVDVAGDARVKVSTSLPENRVGVDVFVVGVDGKDVPVPPSPDPVKGRSTGRDSYSFRFFGVVFPAELNKDGVPAILGTHRGAAVHPREVCGEGFAELGVGGVRRDLLSIFPEVFDLLMRVAVFLRDLLVHPLDPVCGIRAAVGSGGSQKKLLNGIRHA